MRLLRGGLGLVGGVALLFGVVVVLFGGNWHMGYTHDRVLVPIFGLLVPAAAGIVSPLWYWVGRPVWARLDRPGERSARRLRRARFLPGLAGSVLGVALLLPVSATSRFPVQMLAPFGLAVGLAGPLWFWLGRPVAGGRVEAWLPGEPGDPALAAAGRRVVPALAVLLAASVAVTAVIALPVVGTGETVASGDLAITVTDTRTATTVTETGSGTDQGGFAWRLLLVGVAVENRGDEPRRLPGSSVGDIAVIAPACGAQNFGEPSHNCNQVYLDGNFTADGTGYANYDDRQAAVGGTVDPGERVTGWLVFRVESRPTADPDFEAMVVVNEVGRWTLDDGWRDGGAA